MAIPNLSNEEERDRDHPPLAWFLSAGGSNAEKSGYEVEILHPPPGRPPSHRLNSRRLGQEPSNPVRRLLPGEAIVFRLRRTD